MGTKEFNIIDKLISWMRVQRAIPYVGKNDVVLDFGCGHQAYLLDHIKHTIKKGIGLDYDAEPRKIGKNIEIRKFNFKGKLPFLDKTFDTVFLLAVIEHIEITQTPKLFRECCRILTPHGKIVLTTPTPFGKTILEFLAFKLGIISKKEIADHKKYYSRKDVENMAKNYGLKIDTYQTFQLGGNSLYILKKLKN
ncbi:MAG: class I SAM-dependent methyltransferase [Patescibacteria group bacterium]